MKKPVKGQSSTPSGPLSPKALRMSLHRGDHSEVLARTIDASPTYCCREIAAIVIGSLTFRGRLEEAEFLYSTHLKDSDDLGRFEARFFLGMGFCRYSQYDQARAFLVGNVREASSGLGPEVRFFVHMGLGFYRYFCGRFRRALHHSRHALRASLEADSLYGKALSTDLMGHSLVQIGDVRAGLQALKDAARHLKQLGDGGLASAFQVSSAVYRAQFGVARDAVNELTELSGNAAISDSYSRASLLLELARQHLLRGDIPAARAALDQACPLIYSSHHRRYGVLLSLRYAWISHLEGGSAQALNLVRSAAKELNPRVDLALEVETRGMELKLLRALGIRENTQSLEHRIEELTRLTGKLTSARMLKRGQTTGNIVDTATNIAQDPLGDLIDRLANREPQSLECLLESGYYGLVFDLLPVRRGERALLFDLIPASVMVVDRGTVKFHRQGASPLIRSLARHLQGGEISKEDLIKSTWGYTYHPLQHDPLIYRAISRFRHLLGEQAGWIEATELGYALRPGVKIYFHSHSVEVPSEAAPPDFADIANEPELNFRQIRIMRELRKDEFIDVKTCKKMFDVSDITARRDLVGLMQFTLLKRVGRGRAIRYMKVE